MDHKHNDFELVSQKHLHLITRNVHAINQPDIPVVLLHDLPSIFAPACCHCALPIARVHETSSDGSQQHPHRATSLYITDSEIVHQWATKKLFVYRIFKFVFWLFRWLFDGSSFNPTWHSVLYVDDIVKNRRPIFIKDTLVVHCHSIKAFEKLIPFICGPFTRLTIHGHEIKLNQLKRLLLDNVKKVKITARIKLRSDEYDDAVQLILGQVRDKWFNFHLLSTPQLMTRVRTACINHETLIVGPSQFTSCNVQHRKTPLDVYFFGVLHAFLVLNLQIKRLGWFSDSCVFRLYFYFVIIFDYILLYLFYVVSRSKPRNVVCF
uniref:Uncharacterized protein n=1 Tax=Panagrellus redivivus TaxID=6233 RepID=A0A7E4V415_PANRE